MHSIAFEIGGFAIYWYGILAALAFVAGFWTAGRRAGLYGISGQAVVDLAPWLIGGAIIGARIWYVVYFWNEEFSGKPFWEVFMLRRSGLVFYGGLAGASLATILYVRLKALPLWKMADCLAPSIALGHGFGRIGCLMTGCCYGCPTDLPWAVRFPADHWTAGVAVHPTQIYESALNFTLYAGLAWLYPRKRFDGQIFAVYLCAYSVLRAVVESFRGDYPKRYLGGVITPGQIFSVLTLVAGVALFLALKRRKQKQQEPAR
ncbi:MAG: prolipoprotein diacylglyceryl transferase [Verrucomicrobia bacterium]|nr:prolipoprotein diacylglyceryl transferase [Verrucomicrobiota bacterium]